MFHVVVLKFTLAGLVADRAIERMVGEQKLQDVATVLQSFGCPGLDNHPFRDGGRTGRLQFGIFFDFDQAHPATADNRKAGMIAITRNPDPRRLGRFNDQRSFRRLNFPPVNSQFDRFGHNNLKF